MLTYRSFSFRAYPTAEQAARLLQWENALRFLWNLANEQRLMGLSRPKSECRYPSAFGQQRELTELRSELPWLADVSRGASQKLLVDLDLAWRRCFSRKASRPRWKKKGEPISFTETFDGRCKVLERAVSLPKLGEIRCVMHRATVDSVKWLVDCEIARRSGSSGSVGGSNG